MNCFQNVKYGVSCREATERYGVEVNHYGMARCPFHNDRHPSLYVADDHYYCFACGEHGDVIDFAARLFGLPLYEAAQRLAADFHLTPDKPPSAAALHAKRVQIKTTSKLVVCTDPRRVITGKTPKGALKSLTPHYHYRPPLKRPVFMPSYSCYP